MNFLVFCLYFLLKIPIDRLIYTNIVTDPPSFHFQGPNQGFLKLQTSHYTIRIVDMMPPHDFDGWWHVFLAIVEIYVDETVLSFVRNFFQKYPKCSKFASKSFMSESLMSEVFANYYDRYS